MSNLFKNEYRVFLYKYNYSKLKDVVSDKFADATSGSAYQYLFESFITDLYSLGIPSDEIRKDYQKYVVEYSNIKNTVDEKKLKQSQKSGYTVTTYKPNDKSLVDKDTSINAYRSPKTPDDNILQEALAQNYALQKLQKDYEDQKMMNGDNINWLNTKQGKIAYEQGLKSALAKSKELLNSLFDPVIDDIVNIRQSGKISSDYVYCIELTDLSNTPYLDVPITERTKNSCDKFLNSKVSNRLISDDLRTNALSDIGTIKTDLTQITNTTSFTLRQDILLKYNIDIEPNDVIEIISTNYNKAINYTTYDVEDRDPLNRNTQFLGFVTQLSLSNKYGQVSDLTVTCEGISKLLTMNPVVSDNAVSPQFNNLLDFIAQPKKNPSEATTVNVYVTQYNNSTVYELFTDIMSKVLAATPIDGDTQNYTVRYVSDPKKLKGLQYQYCKPLIVLYHLAASISTVRQCGPTEVIIAKVDCNILQTKLQAYLRQLRTNFTNFWSTYSSPIQILNAIVENSFLEIYEDRCGILIMRTPRYNTWLGKDIIDMHDVIEWTQTINDVSLKSRSDYQWCIDYLGTMRDFPGGAYENIPALLKYGFRADSPKTSPNAKNEKLCAVFGALDVARANSKTRIIRVTVPMIQDYILGKLYYLPVQDKNGVDGLQSVGCVGYLSSITSNINPGGVDQHVLEFTYVRNAELLENDPSMNENYGNILNFNHLPDLEMMMNLFTDEDIEQPAKVDTDDKAKSSGLPSQYYYYWAAYKEAYKAEFDNYAYAVDLGVMTPEEKKHFDETMAPTVLSKDSFRTYSDGKNKLSNLNYIPTQQLINTIWFIDMCLRYNEPINVNIITGDYSNFWKNHNYSFYWAKILRSLDFKKDFETYINRDKTFGDKSGKITLPTQIKNELNNYYAHVNGYFINESAVPSMIQPINQVDEDSQIDRVNNYMLVFKKAYSNIKLYNQQQKINFINKYISSSGEDKDKIKKFNNIFYSEDFYKIIEEYDEWRDNDYNFINLYSQLYDKLSDKSKNSGINYLPYVKGMLKDFYNTDTNFWKAAYKQIIFYNEAKDFYTFNFDSFLNYLNFKGVFATSQSKKQPIQHLIPAIKLNSNKHAPLRIFNSYDYGSFLAGVSPIDYNEFFKNRITKEFKLSSQIESKSVTLEDKTFKDASDNAIGTIEGFVYDSSLSDDVNLYFYPIISFFDKNLNSKYMVTAQELRNFRDTGSSTKQLASLVVIAPTKIPESKIPTIQQIALQKGLYVGKIDDGSISTNGDDLNTKAAIIDPSVLYNWTSEELGHTYTATIYNMVSPHIQFKSKDDLKTNKSVVPNDIMETALKYNKLNFMPCVFSSYLNFSKFRNTKFTHSSIKDRIDSLYYSIGTVNKANKFFTLKNIKGSNYYQLEDRTLVIDSASVFDRAIILEFANDYAGDQGFTKPARVAPKNNLSASIGHIYENYDYEISDSFDDYIKAREQLQLSLYTDNANNSTIFYRNCEKYPTSVKGIFWVRDR